MIFSYLDKNLMSTTNVQPTDLHTLTSTYDFQVEHTYISLCHPMQLRNKVCGSGKQVQMTEVWLHLHLQFKAKCAIKHSDGL